MFDFVDKIFKGDCLEKLGLLPNDSIDLGITSPPYNKGEKNKGWLVRDVKYKASNDSLKEEDYQQNQIDVLNELYRVIKPGGSFFYNHKCRWDRGEMFHPYLWLQKTKWSIRQEIIWDRMIAANLRGWRYWQVDERIYWLYKPINNNLIGKELESKHSLLTSIWRFPPEKNSPHPAPFPIELPARIIYSILNEDDGIIIDPYCGSGTTLVASKLLGKNYIGIEIADEYIKYSTTRLEKYLQEKTKVEQEIEKHIVKKTFKERKQNGDYVGRFRNSDVIDKNIAKLGDNKQMTIFN